MSTFKARALQIAWIRVEELNDFIQVEEARIMEFVKRGEKRVVEGETNLSLIDVKRRVEMAKRTLKLNIAIVKLYSGK